LKKCFLWRLSNCRWLNNLRKGLSSILWSAQDEWQKKAGFSLVELLVVIVIVALLSTLASVNLSFLNGTLVKSEIQKLHTVCHYLRRKAMMTNQSQKLIFDISNNEYRYGDNVEKFAQLVSIGFLPGTKGPPSTPSRLIQNPITFKNSEIIFYQDGIVSSGTVYLIDTNKCYQYALSVPIAQISYLRMYYHDKKWKLVT